MIRKKLLKIFMFLGIVFISISNIFSYAQVHGDVIKTIDLRTNEGGTVGDVKQWQEFRVEFTFELPNGAVKNGDTTEIKLPDGITFGNNKSVEIKNKENTEVIARLKLDMGTKIATLTYTDYAEKHSDVSGSFYFYSRVDHDVVKAKKTIPMDFNINGNIIKANDIKYLGPKCKNPKDLNKAGWNSATGNTKILSYFITINQDEKNIQNAVVEDIHLGNGINIKEDSIRIFKGTWTYENGIFILNPKSTVTDQFNIQINPEKNGFKIELGNILENEGYEIRYDFQIDYEPVNGEKFENIVKLSGSNKETVEKVIKAQYNIAGGVAEGYTFNVRVEKKSDDQRPLANAKFKLIRESNKEVIGEFLTDDNGVIEFTGLLKDDYNLIETEAPLGYTKNATPIKITPADFANGSKTAIVEAINKREKISIPVEKQWVGTPLKEVVVNLKADGNIIATEKLNAKNNWKHVFDNLDRINAQGKLISYTVEENDNVGYVKEIKKKDCNDITKGFLIKNTEQVPNAKLIDIKVKKIWKDSSNKDTVAPVDSIEVELYRDGVATGVKKLLNNANDWKATFAGLKEAEKVGASPYKYTVKEVLENNGNLKVANKNFTVKYEGSMEDGFTILNKEKEDNFYIPEYRSINVEKTWTNGDGKTIDPATKSIEVELYKDGKATGIKKTLNAENSWKAVFENLPVSKTYMYEKHVYTVKEVNEVDSTIKINGKDFDVIYSGDMDLGFKIENRMENIVIELEKNDNPKKTNKSRTDSPKKSKILAKTGISNNYFILALFSLMTILAFKKIKIDK